jgi:hypothetical protein
MPSNGRWLKLTMGVHVDPPPVSGSTLGEVDGLLEECARGLGFTLDKSTTEAAILGTSLGVYIHHIIYEKGKPVAKADRGPLYERQMVVCNALARWLLVERLRKMEGSDD